MICQNDYEQQNKMAKARIGFIRHAAVYITVNIILMIINLNLTPGYYWAKWPHIGWGIGLIFHALDCFVFYRKSSV